jgi:hypothetical protein
MKVALSGVVGATAAIASLALPTVASATFHEMVVREIFPGSTANPGQDYIELQMYASGQSLVSGHSATIYSANGTLVDTETFSNNVANAESQRTILIGAASTVVGVTPDLVDSGLAALDPAGGAACWNAGPGFDDCAAWGNFTGSGLPESPGSPAAPAGVPDGQALRRSTSPGCSTLLERSDDTDSSIVDFSLVAPQPRTNSVPPTEVPCPSTTITKGPSGKTHDRTPTFKFKSSAPSATFECKLDHGDLEACTSPHTLPKLSFGKHKFQVRARVGASTDPSPATQRFKVVKRR